MNTRPSNPSKSVEEVASGSSGSEPSPDPPDEELVSRSRKGDTAAFDELVTRYRGKVYAMINQMVRNDADAWDLSQDAFLKAWKALPRFKGQSSFYTWLYRIAHNVTYDWLRKKKIRPEGEFDDTVGAAVEPGARTLPKQTARPDAQLQNDEIRERIEEALDKLSPEHRSVIRLKEIEGRQYKEIAEILDCSIGTVMSRLFYARKNLQSQLQDIYESI